MGLRQLSQVLALPRDSLARRFPAQVQLHLDQLLGLRNLGLGFYQPPDRFETRLELNFDVESHQALLFPLRRMLNDLAAFLAGRDCGVQRFCLHLEHAEGPDTLLKVGLLAAERDAAMLFELARGRLEPLRIPAPVRNLRLVAEDLPPFVPQHQALFDPRAQQAQPWEQLRERLRARLGDEAVKGLSAAADHRPECAWQAVEQGAQGNMPVVPGSRPGWLLSAPMALDEGGYRLQGHAERIESAGGMAAMCAATITASKPATACAAGPTATWARPARCGCRLVRMNTPGYAELHCLSNFSFQRGASSADELFRRAREQGYQALAITDECTLAGIVRAWQAAKEHQLRLIVGSEVQLQDGPRLVLLVQDLAGYQNLCALITRARRRAQKGEYQLFRDDLQQHHQGLLALWVADDSGDATPGQWLHGVFGERLWLAVHLHRGSDDTLRLERL
ncbi:PHP domain-containing protein, partial [Pseudomonas taiwanensis]|uniref:PHP domain-containing protein n=1 Tax=Pseudomonas taiwanensis TaxID=470150 RepID=UPI00274104C3